MMLAMRFKPDVAQQDHFVIVRHFLESPLQILAWILEVSGKPFFVGADDASRGAAKAFPARIITGPLNQRANRIFGCFPGRALSAGCGGLWTAIGTHDVLPAWRRDYRQLSLENTANSFIMSDTEFCLRIPLECTVAQ